MFHSLVSKSVVALHHFGIDQYQTGALKPMLFGFFMPPPFLKHQLNTWLPHAMGAQQPSEKSTRDSQDFCFQTLLLRQFDFYSWKEISAASNCLFESRSHRSNRKLTGGLWLVEIYIKCTYIYIRIYLQIYISIYIYIQSVYIYKYTHIISRLEVQLKNTFFKQNARCPTWHFLDRTKCLKLTVYNGGVTPPTTWNWHVARHVAYSEMMSLSKESYKNCQNQPSLSCFSN